jgi:hypothetical protein
MINEVYRGFDLEYGYLKNSTLVCQELSKPIFNGSNSVLMLMYTCIPAGWISSTKSS